jgi:modulator of FtsH protease HflK
MRYFSYAALLVLAGSLVTGLAQIRPGERGVVRRFGKVVATPGPGLWIGLPWGMDRVDRVGVDRVRTVIVGFSPEEEEFSPETPPGQLLTGDHNLVNIQVVIHYSVDDRQVIAFVEKEDRVDGLIARAVETVLAEWVAGRPIDEVLLRGKILLPEVLLSRTQERIDDYQLGVQVQEVAVAHLFPPEEVREAFDKVTRAQASIRTSEQNALQSAARTRREAMTAKYQIEKQTESHVLERILLAQAEADRFETRLAQYRRLRQSNSEFLASIWWDEIGQLFSRLKENGRIDLLDNHLGPDGLDITLFPPLPKKNK